jgi:hypothetical protein
MTVNLVKKLRRQAKVLIEKLAPPAREGIEHYDKAIPAEVFGDDFYGALQVLASNEELKNILEIGSSSGEGSTKALIDGILSRDNVQSVALHCLEISKVRFDNLKSHYANLDFVNIHRLSSVGIDSFPSYKELKRFYKKSPSILNNYTFDEIYSWLKKDIEYLEKNLRDLSSQDKSTNLFGIDFIREEFKIVDFDLVVIDGGEFLGWAEYSLLKGAIWICLDDIDSFKCRRAYDDLIRSDEYVLYKENWHTRNGWAIFRRI